MNIDPQAGVEWERSRGVPPLDSLGVARARELFASSPPRSLPAPPLERVEDRTITAADAAISARLYIPRARRSVSPALLFIHGGGWILGDVDRADAICRRLSAISGVLVASVEYRLAPEHQFPVPLSDCFAALLWLHEHAAELGVDPARIAVAGESSGGNLAAALCLNGRNANGPPIALQLLVCPVLDVRMDTPSWAQFGEDFVPYRTQMAWMWKLYLGRDERAADELASPSRATDLRDLPPALIITAENDPLHDEAEIYAARLNAAGIECEVRRCAGQLHPVFGYTHTVDACRSVLDETARTLRRRLTAK